MPTPRSGYHLKDGTKVPGTTTIIGRFKDSGGLIHWAYKQGREHESLAQRVRHEELPEDTRVPARLYEVTEEAADIGTQAHELVEKHINGEHWLDSDYHEQAVDAFGAYVSWEEQSKLTVVEQEMQLVSEEYRFGGTPDAIGEINGELCLVDWKTSNSVYQDYLIQLAAYRHLWETNHPDKPLTGGFHLCRFAKTHGDFSHHYYPNLDEAWEAFKHMRALYDIDKQLKKRAA